MRRSAERRVPSRHSKGFDAKLSVYSYLVSLLPEKIIDDLGLKLELRSRTTASWTPSFANGEMRELLLRNGASDGNRDAFVELTGDDRDYRGYLGLQEMQAELASVVWPSLTSPLMARGDMRRQFQSDRDRVWQAFIEEPLGHVIERHLSDDLIRGLVFTDGRIGVRPTRATLPCCKIGRFFTTSSAGERVNGASQSAAWVPWWTNWSTSPRAPAE